MTDITPERIEKLKSQVPPGTSKEAWLYVISQELWPDKYCSGQRAAVNNHILRCLIADADAREAAKPKEPTIPPCPEGIEPEVWEGLFLGLGSVANLERDACVTIRRQSVAAHVLAALEAYRPGVEMVPIEAFVSPRNYGSVTTWTAAHPDAGRTWHADEAEAIAYVRESVRRVMAEREDNR